MGSRYITCMTYMGSSLGHLNLRRRMIGSAEGDVEAAAEPEIGEVEPNENKEIVRLRLQVGRILTDLGFS